MIKQKLAIILSLFIHLYAFDISYGQKPAYEQKGEILINLHDNSKFAEFKLSGDNLIKTTEGKVTLLKKNDRPYETSWTEDFKKLYHENRIYKYDMEERLSGFLSQYDIVRLQNIQTAIFRHIMFGEKPKIETENIYLTGPGIKPNYFVNYTYDFYPNKQFSHIVYRRSSSALISIETKKVTFPFGTDDLQHIDWSPNGQFVAYSFQGYNSKEMLGDLPYTKIIDREQGTLVIIDIINEKTLLRKNLGDKYISDLAWAPDMAHIGVMMFKPRLGVFPWELLSAIAGHPVYHNTFCLEIYDTNGNIVDSKELDGSYTWGSARIVWH